MSAGVFNERRTRVWWAALALVVAVGAVYLNSLGGAFVFDDGPSITSNPTIRRLGWQVLAPPSGRGITVEGRPLLNLSLALNYALGGDRVIGYHVVNILIQASAALLLFGIVRRTLIRTGSGASPAEMPGPGRRKADATLLALAVALLWGLHPLQTESVTYIVQRAESLMGLFYLLTLYAFIRGVEVMDAVGAGAHSRRGWWGIAMLAALAGAATKEVIVSVPLIVLLYDRAFVAGTFGAAWRVRRGFYLGLAAATWGLLALLVAGSGGRGGTAGFGTSVTWWDYALTQAPALCRYVWLAVWPSPLIFDYGAEWVKHVADVALAAVIVMAGVGATLFALGRRPAWGFVGMWFFCVLAPTSLVPGNRQTLAEHRMYLPLAAVMTLFVIGGYGLIARWRAPREKGEGGASTAGQVTLMVSAVLALGLGLMTMRRNADYRTELGLYRDTVAKRPSNPFARHNLGQALLKVGATSEAVEQFAAATKLEPGWAYLHDDLGNAYFDLGRFAEAETVFRAAIRANPSYVRAHYNLGNTLLRAGRKDAALESFRTALQLRPDFAEARDNLGGVLLEAGRAAEAAVVYEQGLTGGSGSAEAHCNLGTAYLLLDRPKDAIPQFEASLRVDPRLSVARERLAQARQLAAGQP